MSDSSSQQVIDSSAVERWMNLARSGSAEALAELLNLFRPYLLAIANDAIAAELRAKEGASDEEVLLQLKQLRTSYRLEAFVGVNYTFGSKFNNVVNPRFNSSVFDF